MHVEFADYSPFLEDDPIPFPAHPRVVFVGALEFTKGVDVLLDAWPVVLAQVPRAELVIAGDGTMDAALRRRVSRLGISTSVEFVGTYLQFGCVRYWTNHGALSSPPVPRGFRGSCSRRWAEAARWLPVQSVAYPR